MARAIPHGMKQLQSASARSRSAPVARRSSIAGPATITSRNPSPSNSRETSSVPNEGTRVPAIPDSAMIARPSNSAVRRPMTAASAPAGHRPASPAQRKHWSASRPERDSAPCPSAASGWRWRPCPDAVPRRRRWPAPTNWQAPIERLVASGSSGDTTASTCERGRHTCDVAALITGALQFVLAWLTVAAAAVIGKRGGTVGRSASDGVHS